MQKPKRLFRFYGPSKVDQIENWRLCFSSPQYFNDPFDCTPSYERLLDQTFSQSIRDTYFFSDPERGPSWREVTKSTKQLREELRQIVPDVLKAKMGTYLAIACFFGVDDPRGCEGVESLLLWAHYGCGHTGFAIEFDPDHEMFEDDKFAKVIYSRRRPDYAFGQEHQCLLTKSPEWEKENEYRIIEELPQDWNPNARYIVSLNAGAVKGVYLGCRSERLLQTRIVDVAKQHNVPVYAMRQHHLDYALISVPFEKLDLPPESVRADFEQMMTEETKRRRALGQP